MIVPSPAKVTLFFTSIRASYSLTGAMQPPDLWDIPHGGILQEILPFGMPLSQPRSERTQELFFVDKAMLALYNTH